MAPLITHVVIGERVYPRLAHLKLPSATLGSYLAGCLLVDVHILGEIDRRLTHFTNSLSDGGSMNYDHSCDNFLGQLDDLLIRPWDGLAPADRAFVAGYLCHLAADEVWRGLAVKMMERLGIETPAEFPVPLEVILSVCAVRSREALVDPEGVMAALYDATPPDLFRHLPLAAQRRAWAVIRAFVSDDGGLEAYFAHLGRVGVPEQRIEVERQRHHRHWDAGKALLAEAGGVGPYIEAAAARAIELTPRLWRSRSGYTSD
jgi:hypothetical protein